MLQANGHDLAQERCVDGQICLFAPQIDQAGFEPAHDEFQENGDRCANGQGPQGSVGSRRHHTVVNVHGEKDRGQHGLHVKSTKAPQRSPKPVEGRALHGGQGLVMTRRWQFQGQDLGACQGL